jgi:predicted metallopeptidase
MIKYFKAPDINEQIKDITEKLGIKYDLSRIPCVRSRGSASRYILARCHTISRAVQTGLEMKAHYIIEIVSENYDKLPEDEKVKTLIHEIMHIPKAFGGGFKGHRHVNKRAVDKLYREYVENN